MSNFFTLETDSPFAISWDQIHSLDKERPLGLSGHMRVKNEAETLEACIASCLPFLDELIITCQPFYNQGHIDETYELCKKLQKKHKDKIRLFYYTPEVVPYLGSHISSKDLTIQTILKKFNNRIPNNSIHSFAHYSNYGLIQTKYKYYIKIDADQIYFTNKILFFRKLIFALDSKAYQRTFLNKILGKIFEPFYEFFVSRLKIESFLKLMILLNGRIAIGMHGVNIGHKNNVHTLKECQHLYIPLNPAKHKRFQLFSGGGDHIIIAVNSLNLYDQNPKTNAEYMRISNVKSLSYFGTFFFHYGMKKRKIAINGEKLQDWISLDEYLQKDSLFLSKYAKFGGMPIHKKNAFFCLTFWKNKDTQYLYDTIGNFCRKEFE